jgi:hypothetical protein
MYLDFGQGGKALQQGFNGGMKVGSLQIVSFPLLPVVGGDDGDFHRGKVPAKPGHLKKGIERIKSYYRP